MSVFLCCTMPPSDPYDILGPMPNDHCPVYDLAMLAGVTKRHVRRLLALYKPPGFYRTKGGHWRCRGPLTHPRRLRVLSLLGLQSAVNRPLRERPVLEVLPPRTGPWRLSLEEACKVLSRFGTVPAHLTFAQEFLSASENLGSDEPEFFEAPEDVVSPALAAAAEEKLFVVRLRAAAFRLNWLALPMTARNLALAMKMSRAAFYRHFPGCDNPDVVAARKDARLMSASSSAGEVADYLTEESERLSRAAHPKRVPKST